MVSNKKTFLDLSDGRQRNCFGIEMIGKCWGINSVIFLKRIYRRNLPWKRFSSLLPHRLELGDRPNHHESTISPLCQACPVDRQPCCGSGGLHGPGRASLRWSLPAAFWLAWCLKVNLQDALQIHGCSSRLEREEHDLYARPAGVCHHSAPLCHLFILVIQQHMAEWLLIGHPFKVIEPVYVKEMYGSVECSTVGFCCWRRGKTSFAASSGSKCSRVVGQCAVSIGVRDDVPRFFREPFNALRQQHHTTSSLYANPRQISGDIVLWKERCRGHADGSGSPRRAFVFTRAVHSFYAFTCGSMVAFKERKQDFSPFLKNNKKWSLNRTYMFCKPAPHM